MNPIVALQAVIVRELFIDTADDNYITARWCFIEGLDVDWFWLSVHALEKYMKAALLLNGQSAKGWRDRDRRFRAFGHDITSLYDRVRELAPELLPLTLARPEKLPIAHWCDETLEDFVARFHRNGNPDNRYQIFGFIRHREDLFKLDSMVFALRRLCTPLDAKFVRHQQSGAVDPTHRDILARQPDYWVRFPGCKLAKTIDGGVVSRFPS